MDAYNDIQMLLKSIQQNENKWEKRFVDVQSKEKEGLKKDVSELISDVVSASDVYFEHAKEQVLFLYPNLDLSLLEFLKVVRDSDFLDEDTLSSPKIPTPIDKNYGHNVKQKAWRTFVVPFILTALSLSACFEPFAKEVYGCDSLVDFNDTTLRIQ
ncbi:unnamed protein product [Vicia faba]|uniref:Uncharacterized protein n=1 Tax=Vicia faba TaxID=3906 RepID=A0AAV1APX9_VICFA|nr:unnamed protein product [Vicia faba]